MRYVIINAFFSEETAMPKKGRAVGAGRGWGFGWHVPRPTPSPPIFKADQLTRRGGADHAHHITK